MNKTEKEKWLDENSHVSRLMSQCILPMRPGFGSFITVENIEISEDIFKEEYTAISDAYFSVLDKMTKHDKYLRSKKGILNKKLKSLKNE